MIANDLISRSALIAEYDRVHIGPPGGARKLMEEAPTIDPEELRPKGRWKKSGALLECQSCGEIYSQLGGNAGKAWNYCPNCGAVMEDKYNDG